MITICQELFRRTNPNAKLKNSRTRGILLGSSPRGKAALFCLASLALSVSPCLRAQQLTASDILKKLGETYQQVQSYQVSAEMVTQITAGELRFNQGQADTPGSSTGGVLYASSPIPVYKSEVELAVVNPGKYRLQIKDPSSEVLVVTDGATSWTYSPTKKEYTEKPLSVATATDPSQSGDKGGNDPARIYESTLINRYRGLANYSSSFTLEKDKQIKIGSDKIECYVLRLKTEKGTHEIWVDKTRFIVWHSQDSDPVSANEIQSPYAMKGVPYQKTLTVDLKAANFNGKLDGGLFAFVPPDKARRVDSLSPQKK
jgi:outer membrane lipoprotein-sorting protein